MFKYVIITNKKKELILKKILLMSLSLLTSTINAQQYLVMLDDKHYDKSIIVQNPTDDNGFYPNGEHKETGTLYNSQGYDKYGFDINGLGEKICNYSLNNFEIANYGYNSGTNIYWDSVLLGSFVRAANYTFENYLYSYNPESPNGSYTGGYTHYSVCRQSVKPV